MAMTSVLNDPRWALVQARSRDADHEFVYAVISTGIYCRPSCPARRPRPENLRFFAEPSAAEAAGYRPCKRCKPNEASNYSAMVTAACRQLEAELAPGLAELAASAGLSKDHFQRVFKRITGLTPKAYAQAHTAARMRRELAEGKPVGEAIYAAGFQASSRFYEQSSRILGMTASTYKSGGALATIRFAVGQASLGSVLVAQSERGICAILLGDEPEQLVQDLEDRFPRAELIGGDPLFEGLVAQVVGFVEAPAVGLDLPLDIRGTAFQQRVWQALSEIPPGATASYTEIAAKIGAPKAFRAVAQACAANALAVAIPCHRVVRNDGGLSGYRWGVERKRRLLAVERDAISGNSHNKP